MLVEKKPTIINSMKNVPLSLLSYVINLTTGSCFFFIEDLYYFPLFSLMYMLLHAWCSDYTWPKFKFTAQKGTLSPRSITPTHVRSINLARLEPQTTVNSFCVLLEMKMIAWCWASGQYLSIWLLHQHKVQQWLWGFHSCTILCYTGIIKGYLHCFEQCNYISELKRAQT